MDELSENIDRLQIVGEPHCPRGKGNGSDRRSVSPTGTVTLPDFYGAFETGCFRENSLQLY